MALSKIGKALGSMWGKTGNKPSANPPMSGHNRERMKVIARGRSDKAGIANVEKTGSYKRGLAKRQKELSQRVAKARKSA